MPELPEVETVRRTLEPAIVGARIIGLSLGAFAGVIGDLSVEQLSALIVGRTIVAIRRRGKYLVLDLDDASSLVVHLRMTGQFSHAARDATEIRFQHLALHLDDGWDLRFADQRKFGRVLYVPELAFESLGTKLGPEPLSSEFTANRLASALSGRRAPIKAVLLDQRAVAGIGNIYADEALFLARVHPLHAANELDAGAVRRLHRAIRRALSESIANRGTTFSSYRDGLGEPGSNQRSLRVYGRGRAGEPCPRCRCPLAVLTVAGRSSHYCPWCQSAPTPGDLHDSPGG